MEIKQNFISSERMFRISSDILVNSHQDNKLKIYSKGKKYCFESFFLYEWWEKISKTSLFLILHTFVNFWIDFYHLNNISIPIHFLFLWEINISIDDGIYIDLPVSEEYCIMMFLLLSIHVYPKNNENHLYYPPWTCVCYVF